MRARALLAAFVCAGLACAPEGPPDPPAKPTVELVAASGEIGFWQREARRGLDRIVNEIGAEIVKTGPEETLQAPDVIFVAGGGEDDLTAFDLAGTKPESRVVVVAGELRAEDITNIVFRTDGAGYLAGVLAALISDQGVVGVIRGTGGGWLESVEHGFVDGFTARRGRRSACVAEGPEAAWQVAGAGADVALYLTEVADEAVLAAAHDAGLRLIAVDANLLDDDGDVVVAAVVVDVGEAMLRVARDLFAGVDPGAEVAFDLASGVVGLRLSPMSAAAHDEVVGQALAAARDEVVLGVVEIERLGI